MADVPYGFDERDVARIAAAVRGHESGTPRQGHVPFSPLPDRNYTRIPFRNTSGEEIPKHAVMRITGIVTVDDLPVCTVAKPNTSFGRLYLVNGAQTVAAYSAGVEPGRGIGTFLWHADNVLYDTANTPAYGESWGPQNNTWTLKKNRYGFTIKGGNTGSGSTAKTVAVQHIVNEVYVKAQGAIGAASSGTAEVYDGAGSIVTSTTISVYNPGDEIADDTEFVAIWCGGRWVAPPKGSGGGSGDTVDMVQVDDPDGSNGQEMAANADGLHSGIVTRFTDGTPSQPGTCWLLLADDYDDDGGDRTAIQGDYYGPARKSGQVTSESSTRDLYVCRRGAEQFEATIHRGTADAAIAKGASGTVSRYTDGTNSDSGINDTVYVDRENVRSSTVVVYEQIGSNYYAIECEPRFDIYRGTADAAIAKGATGTVSRYNDGANTDSGVNDSVINDYEYIPSGAKVTYIRLGSNYYAVGVDTAIAIHRGVTSSTSTKGGTCTVDRYTPGTTSDSGINDTVSTPDAAIANGKNITYLEQAGTMYALQWGKQTLKLVVGTNSPRIKSGDTQIEASCIADVEVDSKETAAYEDKIALTDCES